MGADLRMRCGMRLLSIGIAWAVLFVLVCSHARADGKVAVVIGTAAPEVERFAASELCDYLNKLFGVQAVATDSVPADAEDIFLVGGLSTNRLIGPAKFEKPTDRGVVLKSASIGPRSTMIVGGGSPRATLWAVYELAE